MSDNIISAIGNWLRQKIYSPAGSDHCDNQYRQPVLAQGDSVYVGTTASPDALLITYHGPEAARRAQETAANLQLVIKSGALQLVGPIYDYKNKILKLDPNWLWWNTITLVDLSAERLYQEEASQKIYGFINQLKAHRLIPPDKARAVLQIIILQDDLAFRPQRDPRLLGYLQLTKLNMEAGDYDQADAAAEHIRRFPYTVTSYRPMFYHEANFLLFAEIRRLQAIETWSPEILQSGINRLAAERAALRPLQTEARRYDYELLRSCQDYEALFDTDFAMCQPSEVEKYYQQATSTHNHYEPAFADNFIALKSMLERAEYYYNRLEYAVAANGYDQTLKIMDWLPVGLGSFSVLKGDRKQNWRWFLPHISGETRWLGEHFGPTIGLGYFAFKSELAKAVRIGVNYLVPGKYTQFDPDSFQYLRARALRGKAQIALQGAYDSSISAAKYQLLLSAEENLKLALKHSSSMKVKNPFEFYHGGLVEERQIYFNVATDYAEVELMLYYLTGEKKYAYNLKSQLTDLIDFITHDDDQSPANLTLIKAQTVLASVYELRPADLPQAEALYDSILKGIDALKAKVTTLTPYYTFLRGIAKIKQATILAQRPLPTEADLTRVTTLVEEGNQLLVEASRTYHSANTLQKVIARAQAEGLAARIELYLALDRTAEAQTVLAALPAAHHDLYARLLVRQMYNQLVKINEDNKETETTRMLALCQQARTALADAQVTQFNYIGLELSRLEMLLYVTRNKPSDQDSVIELSGQLLSDAQSLNEQQRAYAVAYADLYKGIAIFQKKARESGPGSSLMGGSPVTEFQTVEQILLAVEDKLDKQQVYRQLDYWDVHSYRAELYHHLANVYSILEKLAPDQYRGQLYEYVQKSYREIKLSTLAYDQTKRLKKLNAQFADIPNAYGDSLYPADPTFKAYLAVQPADLNLDGYNTAAWRYWKTKFIQTAGGSAQVRDYDPLRRDNQQRLVSERLGYGLFLANAFNDTATAQQLFAGTESQAINANGLHAWWLNFAGEPVQSFSALDADLYIAQAAIKLSPTHAQEMIKAIWRHEIIERGGRLLLKPSDDNWPLWGNGYISYNPSYFTPALLKELAAIDQNQHHDWQKLIDDNYVLLEQIIDSTNALPDTILVRLEGGHFKLQPDRQTQQTGLDAIRVYLELGRDAIINHDPRAIRLLQKLLAKARITSVGSVPNNENRLLYLALYAVALKGSGDPQQLLPQFQQELKTAFGSGHFAFSELDSNQYYKQSLVLMARLLL